MSTLTAQEKAALLVLFGKSTTAGKGFTQKELRIILLIADGMFLNNYFYERAERLAADIQLRKDQNIIMDVNEVMDMEAKRNATEFERTAEEQGGGVTVLRDGPEFETHPQEQFPEEPPIYQPELSKEQLTINALELLIDVLKGKP